MYDQQLHAAAAAAVLVVAVVDAHDIASSLSERTRLYADTHTPRAWRLQACPRTSAVQRGTIHSRDVVVQRACVCVHANVRCQRQPSGVGGRHPRPARASLPDAAGIAAADALALGARGIATAASTAGAASGGGRGGCAGLQRALGQKLEPQPTRRSRGSLSSVRRGDTCCHYVLMCGATQRSGGRGRLGSCGVCTPFGPISLIAISCCTHLGSASKSPQRRFRRAPALHNVGSMFYDVEKRVQPRRARFGGAHGRVAFCVEKEGKVSSRSSAALSCSASVEHLNHHSNDT